MYDDEDFNQKPESALAEVVFLISFGFILFLIITITIELFK